MRGKQRQLGFIMASLLFTSPSYCQFTTSIHRVGQGNCITLEVPQKKAEQGSKKSSKKQEAPEKKYMVIDCGTSEFRKSPNKVTTKNISSLKPSILTKPLENTFSTPKKLSSSITVSSHEGAILKDKTYIPGIREALGAQINLSKSNFKGAKDKIHVKTVVVSHPDEDHFGWLPDILLIGGKSSVDTIENIVLGGRPDHYLKNERFRTWLKNCPKNVRIYFLAVRDFKIDTLKNDIEFFEEKMKKFSEEQKEIFSTIEKEFLKGIKEINTLKKEQIIKYLKKSPLEKFPTAKNPEDINKINEFFKAVTDKVYNPSKELEKSLDDDGNYTETSISLLLGSAKKLAIRNSLHQFVEGYDFKYDLGPSLFFNANSKETIKELQEAFDFGDQISFELLVGNPLHIPSDNSQKAEKTDKISNTNENKQEAPFFNLAYNDDNVDSLVLRAVNRNGEQKKEEGSITFLGDATAVTLERMKAHFYPHYASLTTNILVAAHHGATSEGSNNKNQYNIFQPSCVIFSNGLHGKYHHPRKEAYDNAKPYVSIMESPHDLTLYGHEKGEEKEEYHTYETKRAVFSTFDNGAITVKFGDEKSGTIDIETKELGKKYTLPIKKEKSEKLLLIENKEDKIQKDTPPTLHNNANFSSPNEKTKSIEKSKNLFDEFSTVYSEEKLIKVIEILNDKNKLGYTQPIIANIISIKSVSNKT